jgi:hypothetical protein
MKLPSSYHYESSPFKSRPHLDPRRFPRKSPIKLQTPKKQLISPNLKNHERKHQVNKIKRIHIFELNMPAFHSPMKNPPSPLKLRNLRDFIPGRDGLSCHFLNEPGMMPTVFDHTVPPPVRTSVLLSLRFSREWIQRPLIFSKILDYLTAQDLGCLDISTLNSRILRNLLFQGWELLKSTQPILPCRK